MDEMVQAMTWNYPARIPVWVNFLPATWFHYGDEAIRLAKSYPDLIYGVPDSVEQAREQLPPNYRPGRTVDEWGCVWENAEEGMESYVVEHPVKTREAIRSLEIPTNRDGRLPHGLMYLRLLNLRGFEEVMIDFAEECEEIQILIDKVLEYNLIQVDCALQNAGELVILGDDLGMQNGLALGAEKWRKYMKPCFRQIFGKIRATGRQVYMHTDGQIYEIMPDLYECGASMINPQYRANGLDNLARVCKGKIPINLDLDRQMYPFATPSQLDDHVREAVETMYLPQGGLGLNIELNYEIPLENMAAILDAVQKYRYYKG